MTAHIRNPATTTFRRLGWIAAPIVGIASLVWLSIPPAPPQLSETGRWGITAGTSQPASPTPSTAAVPVTAPRVLTVAEVREVQTLLKGLGFDSGGADGVIGPMTLSAVQRFEASKNWPVKGEVDIGLLNALRANAPAALHAPRASSPPQPSGSLSSGNDLPPSRLARTTIWLYGAPCGSVSGAMTAPGGHVLAECTNGMIYAIYKVSGGYALAKRNTLTGAFEPY